MSESASTAQGRYKLKFALAGRRFFSLTIPVEHIQAFGRHPVSRLRQYNEQRSDARSAATMFWSAELDRSWPDKLRADGMLYQVTQRFPRYITRFDGSFEDLLSGLSAKRRSTLRRKVRKFAKEDGGEEVNWREYRSPEELDTFFEHVQPLAQKTYQARLFDGALPEDADFRSEASAAAGRGLVRAYVLFLHKAPVAYLYAPQEGDSLIYAYLGYDPDVAHLSPGTVLQYLVHERLFDEQEIKVFDFTAGEGAHKALFANSCFECCDVLCLPDKLAWRMVFAVHRSWDRLALGLSNVAQKLGIKARVKKLIRGTG